ncbi:hypothetical protein BST81_24295 [Leptolyngbya sp. 'hensonii']|uniref:serine hydrolase n=1 Tax=Leptolyngbya sp. 'hensonii' TaxID=1922337 RepID=UPI00094FFF43|nr:serine hydrolase [Leptolyngbya sp. 'hensonii']OLP15841.1 hypothetical protein BST81_24295 [Leptolyngbya sp. 'hensonii']
MFQNRPPRRRTSTPFRSNRSAPFFQGGILERGSKSAQPPTTQTIPTTAPHPSMADGGSRERSPRRQRSPRRSRRVPPGGSQRQGQLPYPLKVAIVALVIAVTGISTVEASRKKSIAGPGPTLSAAALPIGELEPSNPAPLGYSSELVYNISRPPDLDTSLPLQEIVDDTVNFVSQQGLPTRALSISLIDVKLKTIAGYQAEKLRYPASVAKLFWMVTFYGRLAAGSYNRTLPTGDVDLYKMMEDSNNTSAARIMDWVTDTESGPQLEAEGEFNAWLYKREWVNRFFHGAGYDRISLSQKNFPYDDHVEPEGRDLQLLKDQKRNRVTTYHAARLLYEIFNRQAVSEEYSRRMVKLLTKDLRPEAWSKKRDNPIQSFFGESLSDEEVTFASKVGWTSTSRQEAALIQSRDGKVAYILVVFGDHKTYADSWNLFPQISARIHKRMMAMAQPEPPAASPAPEKSTPTAQPEAASP